MDITKILIQTIFSFAQSLLEIPQGRRKAAKTQRKTSNLSITSCKSLNPVLRLRSVTGYPDSDNLKNVCYPKRMFEKWYSVIFITLLPPFPLVKGGNNKNPVPSPCKGEG
jgi:hypothetical protein